MTALIIENFVWLLFPLFFFWDAVTELLRFNQARDNYSPALRAQIPVTRERVSKVAGKFAVAALSVVFSGGAIVLRSFALRPNKLWILALVGGALLTWIPTYKLVWLLVGRYLALSPDASGAKLSRSSLQVPLLGVLFLSVSLPEMAGLKQPWNWLIPTALFPVVAWLGWWHAPTKKISIRH